MAKTTRKERIDAHAYRLAQARQLLRDSGYVEGEGGKWTPASMGKKGGTNRAKKLSKRELSKIGRKGARGRWAKKTGKKGGKPR